MKRLEDMVSSLPDSQEKDLFESHLKKGMHPVEEVFAEHVLLAASPQFSSSIFEQGEAAYSILGTSLIHLPPSSPSSAALMRYLDRRSAADPEQSISDQIEGMLRIANVATLLEVSHGKVKVEETEAVIRKGWRDLAQLSTVAGKESEWPIVLEEDRFFLYSRKKNLRGICLGDLSGKSPGLPIIFASDDYYDPDGNIDGEAIMRIANHEMIHSAQKARLQEEIAGWEEGSRESLLEAITEGLNICRLDKREPFTKEEISKRDYADLVIALFQTMREKGIADRHFSDQLEEMNAHPLSYSASLIGSSLDFMEKAKRAQHALVLQHMRLLHLEKEEMKKGEELDRAANNASLDMIEGLFLPEGSALEIIDQVLEAR